MPAKQLASTEASIRAAQEVGAEQTPRAALQLKLARDGVERAQQWSKDGNTEAARAVLQEAELDAELAVLIAKQEKLEASAVQAKQRADSLEQAKSAQPQTTSSR
jgi:hypothetical protein